jgi:predicted nucleic acid-binding protein
MHVVADAPPLRYLLFIGHIDLLPTLFTQIIIPPAVLGELQRANTSSGATLDATFACLVYRAHAPAAPCHREEVLGAGEREALALAEELHADLVLIDEDKGR